MEAGELEKHYLKIVSFSEAGFKRENGFVCINTVQSEPASQGSGCQKAFLRHFSLINMESIPKALKLVTDFVWKNIQCESIVFEYFLIRSEETGELQAEPCMKQALSGLGFKKKGVRNDANTGRISYLMELSRP